MNKENISLCISYFKSTINNIEAMAAYIKAKGGNYESYSKDIIPLREGISILEQALNEDPAQKKYEKQKAKLAFDFCPPIKPCVECGHPYVEGYCCQGCGSSTPYKKGILTSLKGLINAKLE